MNCLVARAKLEISYSVHFSDHLFAASNPLLGEILGSSDRLFVIDSGVLRAHPHLRCQVGEGGAVVLPGGERCKQQRYLVKLLETIHERQLCRHSYLVAVGGGAVLDVCGLAAALAHRGLRLVRIPTTVLAQNDSGVGVKNGINAFGKKNYLGTFSPPWAVLNDREFLRTLSSRDVRSGLAEAVKVALLKDEEFFDWLDEHRTQLCRPDYDVLAYSIHQCARLHIQHITGSGDPFEAGSSRPLDFGHWAAHRLESLSEYRLRHGEAVAVGLALDCTASCLAGTLRREVRDRIIGLLVGLGFRLCPPDLLRSEVYAGLEEFREHLGGRLTVSLLNDIGKPVEVNEYPRELVRRSIRWIEQEHGGANGRLQRTRRPVLFGEPLESPGTGGVSRPARPSAHPAG